VLTKVHESLSQIVECLLSRTQVRINTKLISTEIFKGFAECVASHFVEHVLASLQRVLWKAVEVDKPRVANKLRHISDSLAFV
jgi:hypothetical protein